MPYLDSAGYRLLSSTEPVARNDRDDSLGHHDDKLRFQMLSSTTEVSELPAPFLSLSLPLPGVDTMALSNLQHELQAPGAKEIKEGSLAKGEECSIPGPPLTNFHLFGNLPTELRFKIWHMSFLPRVVELHPTWLNHAAAVQDDGSQQQWQSGCNNPAALSVCSEARQMALEHFRIAYPLASKPTQQETKIVADPVSGAVFSGEPGLRRRVLYISPEDDTVALLGQDIDLTKLSNLLDSFRNSDLKQIGITSLALSTGGQRDDVSITTNFDTAVLRDLNQLILFPYGEFMPPIAWSARGAGIDEQSLDYFRKMGNKCELVPCRSSNAWYVYKEWRKGKGQQFWDNQRRILHVGKNRIRIQDLEFSTGW